MSPPGAGSDEHAGHVAVTVRASVFVDSVTLMRVADEIGRLPDVTRAVLVMATGILPQINTGIAHRQPGVGQIGAGLVRPPLACFSDALRALADERRRA